MSRSIEIDNCLDCPHLKRITSKYTGDSFDSGNQDFICINPKTSGRRRLSGQHEIVMGRLVVVAERWERRSDFKIPKWCPLKVVK